jgi:hypothetical protein
MIAKWRAAAAMTRRSRRVRKFKAAHKNLHLPKPGVSHNF